MNTPLKERFQEGSPCTANRNSDQWFEYDSRPFIGKPCEIVKVTKNGLVNIKLVGTKKVFSFSPNNVDVGTLEEIALRKVQVCKQVIETFKESFVLENPVGLESMHGLDIEQELMLVLSGGA